MDLNGPIYSFYSVSKRKQQRYFPVYYPLFRIHSKRFSQQFDGSKIQIRTEKFFLGIKNLFKKYP